MIVVIDFGGQTAHLIVRRLRDLGLEAELIEPNAALSVIKKERPAGIVLSGGPDFVNRQGAPVVDKRIFNLKIPILGICYGWQLVAHLLGGMVKPGKREYGPTDLKVSDFSNLFYGLPNRFRVFESHWDTVYKLPSGFKTLAKTGNVEYAAASHEKRQIFGVQFHPEMQHTKFGKRILKNFVTRVCGLGIKPKSLNIKSMVAMVKEKVGHKKVVGAFSGGTDSAVAATLVARAIGKQFIPVYIDSGLMRSDNLERIKNIFPKILGVKPKIIRARKKFLSALARVKDPEKKRKVIGKLYIDLFEAEAKKYQEVKYLLQGTTYADFIQAEGRGGKHSALIKSHHNVGGLPARMKLRLLEPLRYYYTDQVRQIGLKLGLPRNVVFQQPYPGPGHAVRIVGEVTAKRLKQQVLADQIVVEELKKLGWYSRVFQSWSVMTGAMSTGVKGDGRFYGEVVALRIVNSEDRMTCDWVRLPAKVLARLSTRIVNEVPGVSRVVYDITTKPPATMEWE